MSDATGIAARLAAFTDELVRAGVREAVVCPGSRSTPVALALRANAGIRVRVLIDERSAGFYALGIAKTMRRPVVLLATSGTAAVNFAPAVVEAFYGRVPLVVLTADRPPELRDRGAPQTIDQNRLYGPSAKWYAELALGDDAPDAMANLRFVAARAVAEAASGPAGPVHLNLPLRDPLIPAGSLAAATSGADAPSGATTRPFVEVVPASPALDGANVAALAARFAAVERGLIVAGPLDDPAGNEPIARLAAATGYPIVADPLSGLRRGPHDRSLVLIHGDHVLRPGPWLDAHRPEIVVRFGAMPTSKWPGEMMRAARPELFVFDAGGGWREPVGIPATFVRAGVAAAGTIAGAVDDSRGGETGTAGRWARAWLEADAAAEAAMSAWLGALREPFEGAPFRALADLMADGSILWSGNSMPVRDMDAWLPAGESAIRILSNRGANGIDGVVSTALGSAAVAGGPVALVVGDVSFLHDLGALVTARLHAANLLVIVVNNDGGGIFSLLPQGRAVAPGAGLPEHYEELFGTPHGIALRPIVESFGFRYTAVGDTGHAADDPAGDPANLRAAIADELDRPGLRVIELRTERTRNAALHDEVAAAVAAALEGLQ